MIFHLIQYSDFGISFGRGGKKSKKTNKNTAIIIMSEADVAVVGTRSPQQPVLKTCSFAIRRQDRKRVVATTAGNKERKSFSIS
jgi:hypothetical protein